MRHLFDATRDFFDRDGQVFLESRRQPSGAPFGRRARHVDVARGKSRQAKNAPCSVQIGLGQYPGVFPDGLKHFGFVPEQNVPWQPQCFQTETMLPGLVTELVRQEPAVMVVTGTPLSYRVGREIRGPRRVEQTVTTE
jgi:hypothetical protein